MKIIFVLFFSIISLTVFANDTKESSAVLTIADNLIETVNSNSKQFSSMTYFNDGPCHYRTGIILCGHPCNNGSSYSTGCHSSDAAAGTTMAEIGTALCGSCGAVITYEVHCED